MRREEHKKVQGKKIFCHKGVHSRQFKSNQHFNH